MNCQGRLFELVTLELRPEGSERQAWEKSISSRMNSMCKGPVVGVCLAVLRNSKEARVVEAW